MRKVTPFQNLVYDAIKLVPEGKITTYKEIAKYLKKPNSYRAIGNALRKNPFAPQVPCHRCVRSNGEIGGFSGEVLKKSKKVIKKIKLLTDEKVQVIDFKINLKDYLFKFDT